MESPEQIKEAFGRWHHLEGKHHSPDQNLKEMAVGLLADHSYSQVGVITGFSSTTIRNWEKSMVELPIKQPTHAAFVSLPFTQIATQKNKPRQQTSSVALKLKLPHGMQLIIPAQSAEETSRLIRALVEELSSCSI